MHQGGRCTVAMCLGRSAQSAESWQSGSPLGTASRARCSAHPKAPHRSFRSCRPSRSSAALRAQALVLEDYLSNARVAVAPDGRTQTMVDAALGREKHSRHIALRIGSFLAASLIVAGSDLLGTLRWRVAKQAAQHLPLQLFELPFPSPNVNIYISWHERSHDDPGHRWLPNLIIEQSQDKGCNLGEDVSRPETASAHKPTPGQGALARRSPCPCCRPSSSATWNTARSSLLA